jgi:hypothetical protein
VKLAGLEQDVGPDNPWWGSVCKPATTHQSSQRYDPKIMIKALVIPQELLSSPSAQIALSGV